MRGRDPYGYLNPRRTRYVADVIKEVNRRLVNRRIYDESLEPKCGIRRHSGRRISGRMRGRPAQSA